MTEALIDEVQVHCKLPGFYICDAKRFLYQQWAKLVPNGWASIIYEIITVIIVIKTF